MSKGLRVLVIGSGGREHAICAKVRQSPQVGQLWCAPGNPGMYEFAAPVPHAATEVEKLLAWAQESQIDLTIVGPEVPLALGIVDRFTSAGLRIVGPVKLAAQLESSKDFAKSVMVEGGVPTARYETFTELEPARRFLEQHPGAWVLKADGLAAGKGVVVCRDTAEAISALPQVFGIQGSSAVVIEEFLPGIEASFIVACNGKEAIPLLPAHDYKRIGDGDRGPNTGGMGTVCPTPRLARTQVAEIQRAVIDPILRVMAERGSPFRGFLFAGLMIAPNGAVHVLEYNVRLGDPETQSILTMLESDLMEILLWISASEPAPLPTVRWREGAAVCVVAAADGYPEAPRLGDPIEGIEFARSLAGVGVYHAGTTIDSRGQLCTAGGRVLNIVAHGTTLAEARQLAYRAGDMVQFRGKQVRRDIGV